MMTTSVDEKIVEILENFDWDSVLKMMHSVGWVYGFSKVGTSPLDYKDIIDAAESVLRHCVEEDRCEFVESGGFRATKYLYGPGENDFDLELAFVGKSWRTYDFDAEDRL